MYANVVDRLRGEFSDLCEFLSATGGATFLSVVEGYLPKTMLLAAASYFEARMVEEVERFAAEETADNHVLTWLVRNKVIGRQYHTWFAWERKNVNTFLAMFGEDFKTEVAKWIEDDDELQKSVHDFLRIGLERNRLVHGNFGGAILEKTTAEVYDLYESAKVFVDWFPSAIRQYSNSLTAD